MDSVTITVDEKWVDELLKRLDKYEMFKDRRQKIREWVESTAKDEESLKKGIVTQTMVEKWCRDNKVKLVQNEFLVGDNGEDGLARCSSIWIRPFNQYHDPEIYENGGDEPDPGECTVHTICTKCGECIDPQNGCWYDAKHDKDMRFCTECSLSDSKPRVKDRIPCSAPEIDCCRPTLPAKPIKPVKVVKKVLAEKKEPKGKMKSVKEKVVISTTKKTTVVPKKTVILATKPKKK